MTVRLPIASLLRRLAGDRRGNVAVIAALAAIPIMISIGGAVDLSAAYRAQSMVQSAADAAALAAVSYAGTDEAIRKQDADLIFAQNAKDVTASNTSLKLEGQNYVYRADYKTTNSFLKLVHIDYFAGSIQAAATTANTPLDIVLVLDSSGSMAGDSRMVELKKAVTLFLGNFKTKDRTKVALVPFDSQVKATDTVFGPLTNATVVNPYGPGGCAAVTDPLDKQACLDNQSAAAPVLVCANLNGSSTSADRSRCGTNVAGFKAGTTGVYNTGGFLSASTTTYTAFISNGHYKIERQDKNCVILCFLGSITTTTIYDALGSGTTPATSKPITDETANNNLIVQFPGPFPKCFVDRTQPYDVQSDAMTLTNKDTTYPEASCANGSLQPITGLTDDMTALNTAAQKLEPAGNTNITIGVQWGMEAMTAAYPLTGVRSDPKVKKVMIVLTDGLNTQNRWMGSDKRTQINARTLSACTNAKAMGMDVYTVRLITGDDNLLKSCATKIDMFHPVTTAAQLSNTFKELALSVKGVRLVF